MDAQPIYLNVPYAEKKAASDLGAKWDKTKKSWYVGAGSELELFARWMHVPEALDPIREFRDFAAQSGLVLDGDEPYADGQWHYVRVEDAKPNEKKSGAYKLSLDGKPNGFVKNFKNVSLGGPWKLEGLVLSPEERKRFEENARLNRERDLAELAVKQQQASLEAQSEFLGASESADGHAYLQRKGVGVFGVRVAGRKLLVPLRDLDGNITSLQGIYETGDVPKSYTKNGKKAGCFHVIGELAGAETVLFAEGYSTGASLFMATGYPVVVTFDSGNMPVVGKALSEQLPAETVKVWCGDNDVHYIERAERKVREKGLESLLDKPLVVDGKRHSVDSAWYEFSQTDGAHGLIRLLGKAGMGNTTIISWTIHNAGKEKALEAQSLVPNSVVCMPVFSDSLGLPTDFNDMHQKHGLQAVKMAVDKAVLVHQYAMHIDRLKAEACKYFDSQKIDQAFKQTALSRETVVWMDCEEFLALAKPMIVNNPARLESANSVIVAGEKFADIPYLKVGQHGGDGDVIVIEHEGRHRALALMSAGVESMPVVVVAHDNLGIRWGATEQRPTQIWNEAGTAVKPFPDTFTFGTHLEQSRLIQGKVRQADLVIFDPLHSISGVGNDARLNESSFVVMAVANARAKEAARMITEAARLPDKAIEILGTDQFARQFEMGDGNAVDAILCEQSRSNPLFAQAVVSPGVRQYMPESILSNAQACLGEIGNPTQIRLGGLPLHPGDLMSSVGIGRVVAVSRKLTVQATGPDTVVVHQNDRLGEVPSVGELVRIEYQRDKTRGLLSKPCEKGAAVER